MSSDEVPQLNYLGDTSDEMIPVRTSIIVMFMLLSQFLDLGDQLMVMFDHTLHRFRELFMLLLHLFVGLRELLVVSVGLSGFVFFNLMSMSVHFVIMLFDMKHLFVN